MKEGSFTLTTKKPLVLVLLSLLAASFGLAQIPVQLTAGAAGTNGVISFTLNGGDGTSLPVSVAVATGDSGATVAGKIVAAASLTLSTAGTHALLDLSFKAQVAASGYDSKGGPSFLTVYVQGESNPYTVVLRPGQTPVSLMQGIVAYLRLAATGLDFTQVSPVDVHISLRFVHSFISVQTSDVNLQNGLTISDKSLNDQTGLIDR
jgi:hypothetical protein